MKCNKRLPLLLNTWDLSPELRLHRCRYTASTVHTPSYFDSAASCSEQRAFGFQNHARVSVFGRRSAWRAAIWVPCCVEIGFVHCPSSSLGSRSSVKLAGRWPGAARGFVSRGRSRICTIVVKLLMLHARDLRTQLLALPNHDSRPAVESCWSAFRWGVRCADGSFCSWGPRALHSSCRVFWLTQQISYERCVGDVKTKPSKARLYCTAGARRLGTQSCPPAILVDADRQQALNGGCALLTVTCAGVLMQDCPPNPLSCRS